MFKTSFSKYLAAFVITIFIAFAILSGVITALVRNYAFSDTENRLSKECAIVVNLMSDVDSETLNEKLYDVATSLRLTGEHLIGYYGAENE